MKSKSLRTQIKTAGCAFFLTGFAVLAVLAPFGSALASIHDAILYKEYTDSGPFDTSPREFKTTGDLHFEIDINSRVIISVDNSLLRKALGKDKGADTDFTAVKTRLERLKKAASKVNELRSLFGEVARKYQEAMDNSADGAQKLFADALADATNVGIEIKDELKSATEARLVADKAKPAQIQTQHSADLIAIQFTPPVHHNFNWENLRIVFNREISAAETTIDELSRLTHTGIEISAYHYTSAKIGNPVYLTKYNEVEPCERSKFEKLSYELSDGEAAMYEQYQELVEEMESSKNTFSAVKSSFLVEYQVLKPSLEDLLNSLELKFDPVKTDFDKVTAWLKSEKLNPWLRQLAEVSKKNVSVKAVETEIQSLLKEIKEDIATLQDIKETGLDLKGKSAEAAMTQIVDVLKPVIGGPVAFRALDPEVWKGRVARVKSVIATRDELLRAGETVLDSHPGPLTDIQTLLARLSEMPDLLSSSTETVRDFMAGLIGYGFLTPLADLKAPESQKRLKVSEDVGTEFDLQTLCGPRKKGNRLRVEYRFYREGVEIDGGWKDEFRISVLGLHNKYFAGAGFVNNDVTGKWKPTAMLSWVLKYNKYSDKNPWWSKFPGILFNNFFLSGIGVSTMLLDFSEEQDIETGVALTQTLFDERFMAGYGWNLQVEEHRGFWFFSIRVFSKPGAESRERPPGT